MPADVELDMETADSEYTDLDDHDDDSHDDNDDRKTQRSEFQLQPRRLHPWAQFWHRRGEWHREVHGVVL